MAKKLWEKSYSTEKRIEEFTVGNDAQLDMQLASFDVQGSLAHIEMLESIGLLESHELKTLQKELKQIHTEILDGNFTIQDGVEDIHSQVEMLLTERLGDVGKKIHSGRSRNDQVLVDLKLYTRSQIQEVVENTSELIDTLLQLSEEHKDKLLPGYTHLQVAMPSSFGLWFGAYAESLIDDLQVMLSAYKVANKNPLGSAAGYGSSFPLNRTLTTKLLGFEDLHYNVVYAQMSRGKTERVVAYGIAAIASTLAKLSMDVCLYMNQNFGFLTFPDELTTGSSIMPHKKNPDVFELIRGKCNLLSVLPTNIGTLTTNLPSGYHREMQLIKEQFFPAFGTLNSCLEMTGFMLENAKIKTDIVEDEKYKFIFSVEVVNNMVLKGIPFRDAYKKVGEMIANDSYAPSTSLNHTHEGSIGNLCNQKIQAQHQNVLKAYNFKEKDAAIKSLLA